MNPVIPYTTSFTPPIIYLIDGNLTTSLPEKAEVRKTEEFGLSLRSFQKKPYRYKMRGFRIPPFFEDTDPGIKEKRLNPRTRMEPGVPYRINTNGKPGSTSLIKTTQDDENKLLMVTVFRGCAAKGRKDRRGQTGRSGFGPRLQTRRQPVRDKQSYAGSFCRRKQD